MAKAQIEGGERDPLIPHPWLAIRFGVCGNAADYASEGWAAPNETFTWSLGGQSAVSFPTPREQRNTRLSFRAWPLFVPGLLEQQRVLVMVNQRFAGLVTFTGPEERLVVIDLPWQMLSGLVVTTIMFQFLDARSPASLGQSADIQTLGMAFVEICLGDQDGQPEAGALLPQSELPPELQALAEESRARAALFRRFESLGHDCEFGMVQRAFDIHTVGLLKFGAISPDSVARLLEGGLDRIGRRENIFIETAGDGEMLVYDRDAGFMTHSFNYAGAHLGEAALIEREMKRLPRVARKLDEDIESGEKVFVFVDPGNNDTFVARIHAALRSKSANTLLWVRKASTKRPPGLVVPSVPGLLLGFVPERPPRIPGPGFADPDLDCWTTVCEQAAAYHDGER